MNIAFKSKKGLVVACANTKRHFVEINFNNHKIPLFAFAYTDDNLVPPGLGVIRFKIGRLYFIAEYKKHYGSFTIRQLLMPNGEIVEHPMPFKFAAGETRYLHPENLRSWPALAEAHRILTQFHQINFAKKIDW